MRTGRTDSEEEYLMVFHQELGGCDVLVPEHATWKLEKTVAGMAMEMVMMALVGQFVKGSQGRVVDLPDHTLSGQPLQIAIDRGLIEGLHNPSAVLKNILDAQRLALLANNLFDGGFLNRSSLRLFHLGFKYIPTRHLLQINLQ
jgi:hypothetical protein